MAIDCTLFWLFNCFSMKSGCSEQIQVLIYTYYAAVKLLQAKLETGKLGPWKFLWVKNEAWLLVSV